MGSPVKTVGQSGQISLGRSKAGQTFQQEELEGGVILLRPVEVIPTSNWLVRDQEKIAQALEWAAKTPARVTDLEEFLEEQSDQE